MITRALARLALLLPALGAVSQENGQITGHIRNLWDGRPLPGVVILVRGTTLAEKSAEDGQYLINGVEPGEHSLIFSAGGFARATVTQVRVGVGQTSTVDISLRPEYYEMEEYEVLAEELFAQEQQLLLERRDSSQFLESIGADRFSQLDTGDAAEILMKTTGVSVVEGKFAVVRGLSDRYNLTLLNGGQVPTADPYRRSAQLDMFSSDVLEAVTISKTFTPDLPGGFSGALVNLETKSFPEKRLLKASVGLGFNTQSTFNNDFLTYEGGGLDAFGMDDGTRALPRDLENVTADDLTTLRDIYSNTRAANNTPEAIEQKRIAAEQMDAYARSFGSGEMGATTKAPPPDHDFSILYGDTRQLGVGLLGYTAGLSYERDYRFYEHGVRGRYSLVSTSDPTDLQPTSQFSDSRSLVKAQWSGLVNLGYRLNEQHEIGFNFLYSQVGEDEARRLNGRISTSGEDQFGNLDRMTWLNTLYYTERNLTYYQLKGDHEIPQLGDLQIDWLGALGSTYQDEPDLRYFNLITDTSAGGPEPLLEIAQNYIPEPQFPTRYFRHLEDDDVSGKVDLTLPIEDRRQLEWKLKTGALVGRSQRTFEERTFSYSGARTVNDPVDPNISQNVTTGNPITYPPNYLDLAPAPIQNTFPNGRVNYLVSRELGSEFGNSAYEGEQNLNAGYGMIEVPLISTLRLVGGARYETTYLTIDSTLPNDPVVKTSLIEQNDLLPAVNLTWSFRPDMALRTSYAETIARPTYREFADSRTYDQFSGILVRGNPLLTMSSIQNYDLRWEWFTPQSGLVSVSGFYKVVEAPIERVNGEIDGFGELNLGGNVLTFVNGPEADLWGLEFEARQNLKVLHPALQPFSAGANFAWINSEVDNLPVLRDRKLANGITADAESRPLYDQSPYIINADLTYSHPRWGSTLSVIYYYAAERLSLITETHDIYQQGMHSLDVVFTQKLGHGFTARFAAENILNPDVTESYAVDGHTDTTYVFSQYSKGTTFKASISYSW